MTTLTDKAILSGADNRPLMLEKDMYDSWKSRMELYMMNRQHGRMILESVENGPLIWPSIEENGVTRPKKYSELSATEAIQADCDIKATNIILQGLPPEVFALVSNHKVAKELENNSNFYARDLMTKQERECKLYDEFDKFAYKKGETLLNTKFLNTLPLERSTFLTDVKLVRDLHTTNIDQLHAYLGQHEFHANEVRLMHERNSDPLALSQQYSINQSSTPLSITHPSNDYHSLVRHNACSPSSSIPKLEYAPTINQQQQQPEFYQSDLGLTVPVFQRGDDPIDAINHVMTYNRGASGSNSGKQRTVICYNCKGEGHMSKQCTKPKRKQDDSWFKEKVLLVQAQAHSQILNEEELAFLADPDIPEVALMANLSHYGSDALAEVHNHDNVNNNMLNQAVQAMPSSEQLNVMNHSEIEITSDSNIIPYSQTFKEKESLKQTVTLLKNNFKKEESRNIDRENALEKWIKQLDNIKAQQLEPKLYDGNVIEKTNAIVIPDSEETLMLAEENFKKRFVPQTELSDEQAFWSQNFVNSAEPTLSSRPTKVEVPKELPKVSMVNTSLKKLKHHLDGFDVVVKERTTTTAITKGSWRRKLQGKALVDNDVQHPSDLKMLKIDMEPITPKLLNKRTARSAYIKHTQEEAAVLRDLVDHVKIKFSSRIIPLTLPVGY
ncbi:retrovirus-related pol polyprotein from transposon TNT 1-94 [Tanacetum coccineum]